jgi:hypothetical protein
MMSTPCRASDPHDRNCFSALLLTREHGPSCIDSDSLTCTSGLSAILLLSLNPVPASSSANLAPASGEEKHGTY